MTDKTETPETTADILAKNAEVFRKKTTDYGESWKKIGYILMQLANDEPIVLDSREKVIAFGLFTRRMDKFAREFHGTFFAPEGELNYEAVVDSAEDESVYAAMAAENHYDMARQAATEARMAEGYRLAAAEPTEGGQGPRDENGDPTFEEGHPLDPESYTHFEPDSETPFRSFKPSDLNPHRNKKTGEVR